MPSAVSVPGGMPPDEGKVPSSEAIHEQLIAAGVRFIPRAELEEKGINIDDLENDLFFHADRVPEMLRNAGIEISDDETMIMPQHVLPGPTTQFPIVPNRLLPK